jgi:hypothetical protein
MMKDAPEGHHLSRRRQNHKETYGEQDVIFIAFLGAKTIIIGGC